MKQVNPYPLRLEEDLAAKLKILAKDNNRSYNKEIEFILKNYIKSYEVDNGTIDIIQNEEKK